MIQKGWHDYSLEVFFGMLTKGPTKFLEILAKRMSEELSHQSDRDLPHTKFPYGISTISQLQAHEAAGVLLLLVFSLHCNVLWDKCASKCVHTLFVNSRYVDKRKVREYRNLFEMLLCMEAWYKVKNVPKRQIDNGQATAAIAAAMKDYVKTVAREQGHGMEFLKA